jgi:hypothetical protein
MSCVSWIYLPLALQKSASEDGLSETVAHNYEDCPYAALILIQTGRALILHRAVRFNYVLT